MTDQVELVRIQVPSYKNLHDVRFEWTPGLALVGANGAGKTNLLEAMALLFGTDETLLRASDRLDLLAAPGLSMVVRGDFANLPLPLDQLRLAVEDARDPDSLDDFLARDLAWREATNPLEIAAAEEAWALAVVRYTLTRVEHSVKGWNRTFARHLLISDDLDAPSVLALPDSTEAPVRLQWLPKRRTGEEIDNDLSEAWTRASTPARMFASALGDKLPMRSPDPDEANWWLQEMLADIASDEALLTAPSLQVTPDPDYFPGGGVELGLRQGTTATTLGKSSDHGTVVAFSAGQRRWLDEALAHAAAEVRSFADVADLYAIVIHALDEETFYETVMENLEADERVAREEYWDYASFRAVLATLDTKLRAAADNLLERAADPVTQARMKAIWPAIASHRETLRVRAFDEPEAHLHPRSQYAVATALRSLQRSGQNIVVSTHSPAFLDNDDWTTLRVADGSVELLDSREPPARTQLARDLGIGAGDLLNGISWILVVEGEHDRLVLERLYGRDLRDQGVAMVRMFGTGNLRATLELDFVHTHLDVPMTVLLDNSSCERIDDPAIKDQDLTDEELKARKLRHERRGKGKRFEIIGLERPDIIAYLGEAAIRETTPSFPGWDALLEGFRASGQRGRFKEWVLARSHIDLRSGERIEGVLKRMVRLQQPLEGDLPRKIHAFIAEVSAARQGH